jgi:hypothetical protein
MRLRKTFLSDSGRLRQDASRIRLGLCVATADYAGQQRLPTIVSQRAKGSNLPTLNYTRLLVRIAPVEASGNTAMASGRWPNGAPAAVAFTLDNMGEAADIDRGLWPESEPIGSHYSVKEVIPNILELLKKYDITATYFIEAWNLAVYPEAIEQLAKAGHEVVWHAWRHETWSKLTEERERWNFEQSFGSNGLESFSAKTRGQVSSYRGFRPPGGIIHGERTLTLCWQYGLTYISPAGQDAAIAPVGGGGGWSCQPRNPTVSMDYCGRILLHDVFFQTTEAQGRIRRSTGDA